jgi:hypothetical protein
MIRAILKKGKIEPLDALPKHWRDGQELTVEGSEPSDDPAEIKKLARKAAGSVSANPRRGP